MLLDREDQADGGDRMGLYGWYPDNQFLMNMKMKKWGPAW